MDSMFNNCYSLESLDLSSFDTNKVNNMKYMFNNCSSLLSLNINNFSVSSNTKIDSLFQDCKSLLILEFDNYNSSNGVILKDKMIEGFNSKLLFCLNIDSNLINNNEYNCSDISDICQSKIIWIRI